MEANFQIYSFAADGIPVPVNKTEELCNAFRVAIGLAIHVPRRYTICVGQNAFEPILDLDDFEIPEDSGGKRMSERGLGNREQHSTHNEIQQRAYGLYLARGCTDGQDIQDWFFAEQQLRNEYQHEPDERVGIRTASVIAGPGGRC